MEDSLRSRLAATGLVTSRQAHDLGVDHHRLARLVRLVRDGELVRVRAGVYVDGERHRVAEPPTRHLMQLRAVLADGRSESPGETWARLLFHELGLRGLEPQVELRAADGRVIARVDFLDRAHGLVVEFDGARTYAGGGTGQAALVAEKRREDAIRRVGYRVRRLIWSDLLDPARLYRLVCEARADGDLHACSSSPGWGQGWG